MSAAAADHDVAQTVSRALRRTFADARHAVKTIASRTGATVRTAKSWWAGETAPRADQLVRLMCEFDEVRAAVISMTHVDEDPDVAPPLLRADELRQTLTAALALLERP